ncbi:MAG: S41 family peptidase [Planctomycetota bacterium]|jgi:carboxyl-terminal processing protease|nr:S41 family peptidase [Planctomycetota bacterium]
MDSRHLGNEPLRSRRILLGLLLGYGTAIVALLAFIAIRLWGEEDLAHYREVRAFVEKTYAGEASRDELLQAALVGMLDDLDPYSRYYTPTESERMERETRGVFKGIGVVFRDVPADEFKGQILFPLPETPAQRAGLRVGDRITAVDGEQIAELGLAGLRASLSRPADGARLLLIEDLAGDRREALLVPEQLTDPSVRRVRLLPDESGMAHLSLLSFSRETPLEVDRALDSLKGRGMRGLIFDLRLNHGGVLSAAVSVARRFVPTGTIVSTEGRGEAQVYEAQAEDATYAGLPLVVLVDGNSASASEVLAAALQENGAAQLVGEPTYGKGTVQTIRRFHDQETVAKVTSAYYFTPTHRNLDRASDPARDYGLLPDHGVELTEDERAPLHRWLGRYSPPTTVLAALEAWEEAEGVTLIQRPPPDRQLERAKAVLRDLMQSAGDR